MSTIRTRRTASRRVVSLWVDTTSPERPLIISVDWIGVDGLCDSSSTLDVFPRECLTAARSRAAKVASRYAIHLRETPGIEQLIRQSEVLCCP